MGKLIGIIFAVVIGLVAVIAIVNYITWYNYGATTEVALEAKVTDNRQKLGKHSAQIAELAQVNVMYRNDLSRVYSEAMEGRYGENGSGAIMQWIQEQNPNLDPALYMKISQTIEANRNEFAVSQTELLDQKRVYEANLKTLWSGFWLRVAGYPKINLADIKVLSSTHANRAFEIGIDDGIKIKTE